MSRSRGDQRGSRIPSPIVGKGTYRVTEGKLVVRCGGEEDWTLRGKRQAKRIVAHMRRREYPRLIEKNIVEND